jgi:hypoxanthine phosphoribosyltransferase
MSVAFLDSAARTAVRQGSAGEALVLLRGLAVLSAFSRIVSYYNQYAMADAAGVRSGLRVLLSEEQIRERVREMGAQIDRDYPEGPLYLVAILKGACFFLADLARAMTRPARIDFIGISSYGKGKTSSGEVKLTKDLDVSIEGADVLVVEDIVDSGITLSYLLQVLAQRKPKTLRVAALLDKPERRVKPVEVAYVGFRIPDEFVVGYGLDYAEDYRNLRDICVLDEGP